MRYEIVPPERISKLSSLSVSLGNIKFIDGQAAASVMVEGDDIVGFAAVQNAVHAAGSWVHKDFRLQGHSYKLREVLESHMRAVGVPVYFSIPGTDFEKELFAKYGPVTQATVQIRKMGG